MTDPDQDEFVALRRRAYGRDADIHLDPASLARLDELENARPSAPVEDGVPAVDSGPPPAVSPVDPTPEESVPEPWWAAAARHARPWLMRIGRGLRGLRRSTVLISLGCWPSPPPCSPC